MVQLPDRPPNGDRASLAARCIRRQGEMIQPMNRSPIPYRPHHVLTVVATTVVAVVVAYLLLGFLAGALVFLIKTVVVLAIIALAVWLVARWASRGRI